MWSPRAIQYMFRETTAKAHQVKYAARLNKAGMDAGKEASLEIAVDVLGRRKLGPLERCTAESTAADAIWPNTRLQEAGYDISRCCNKCGQPDTLFHRLWECMDPVVVAERTAIAKSALVQLAKDAGPTSVLYTRGLIKDPDSAFPRACNWEHLVAELHVDGQWIQTSLEAFAFTAGARLYTDGSFAHLFERVQGRAGWAAVQVSVDGAPEKRLYGPV